jgi:hypothetical protein
VTFLQLAIVKALGRDAVWELRRQIYEDYGTGTTEDIEESWKKSSTKLNTRVSL